MDLYGFIWIHMDSYGVFALAAFSSATQNDLESARLCTVPQCGLCFSRMSARFKILSSRATMWSWCAKSTLPTSNNYSTWGALVIWRHQWSGSTIHDNDQTDNQYVYTVMYRHMTGNYWHTHVYIYIRIIYIHILYTYTRADACLHTHIHT